MQPCTPKDATLPSNPAKNPLPVSSFNLAKETHVRCSNLRNKTLLRLSEIVLDWSEMKVNSKLKSHTGITEKVWN